LSFCEFSIHGIDAASRAVRFSDNEIDLKNELNFEIPAPTEPTVRKKLLIKMRLRCMADFYPALDPRKW
jgi:hypothetical protein